MASLRATATLRGCRRHESMESHYTAIEQAVSILFARRQKSCSRPRDALEGYLASGRFAVLFRPVATPNFELLRFASLATAHNLTPLVLEYHRDKFVSYCNPIKHALARMRFHNGTGRNGGARITALTVTNISASTGRILADVTTFSGEPLVAFHHHLLSTVGDLREVIFYDASICLGAHAPTARQYYTRLLSLFVEHAILFETFLATPHEAEFTSEVVLPAFDAAYSEHGSDPLICRLDPTDAEGHSYWLQYPYELQEIAALRLSSSTPCSPMS